MIEEHVNKLAELQAERNLLEAEADIAVYHRGYDRDISKLEKELDELKEFKKHVRFEYEWRCDELSSKIKNVSAQIIDEWTGENKTMSFDAGTLKFRQAGSLKIHDELYLFTKLYDHIKLDVLIDKYLKGFNLTAVKKYMSVHELPIDVAEIEYKTTVKLEQKSG